MSEFGKNGRGKDAFDKYAIVLDPQIPAVARRKLRGEPPHGQSSHGRRQAVRPLVLIRFRDPKPQVPLPRRPLTAAQWLAVTAATLAVLGALGGLFGNLGALFVFWLLAIGTAGVGWVTAQARRPALTADEPRDDRLDGWYAEHAEKIFHRRYIVPRVDLDAEGRLAWGKAVGAANQVYASGVLRDGLIDQVQVRAAVPEQLWKIAEGLAQISEVRYQHRKILGKSPLQSAAIAAKVSEQERALARGARRVNQRIGRLEEFAGLLAQADALRQGETVLDRLGSVDELLREMLATTEEKASDLDLAERLEVEAQAVIDQATQAISSLAGPYDDEDDGDDTGRTAGTEHADGTERRNGSERADGDLATGPAGGTAADPGTGQTLSPVADRDRASCAYRPSFMEK